MARTSVPPSPVNASRLPCAARSSPVMRAQCTARVVFPAPGMPSIAPISIAPAAGSSSSADTRAPSARRPAKATRSAGSWAGLTRGAPATFTC